jgi:hypothetical protein
MCMCLSLNRCCEVKLCSTSHCLCKYHPQLHTAACSYADVLENAGQLPLFLQSSAVFRPTLAPASLPQDTSGSAPCHRSCQVLHMLGTLVPLRAAAVKLKLLLCLQLRLLLLLLLLLLPQRSSTLPSALLCSSHPCRTG